MPIQTPLAPTGCNLWLQQCLPSPSLLLQQLGLAGALSGLVLRTATPWLLPGSLPGQKSLLCHRKQKLLYLSPDQLLHVPQKPVQGGETQTSENLAVLLFWP